MNNKPLYVITGATGRTGSAAAQTLLNNGARVRVMVRDETKGRYWADLGAEVVIADLIDVKALTAAFSGAQGAYIVSPSHYNLEDLFTRAEVIAAAIAESAIQAQLPKLVALSSIGADCLNGVGWIAMNRILEEHLINTRLPVALLRASYFMENWGFAIEPVKNKGILPSFLAPLDRKIPMIATEDIGGIGAEVLGEEWNGARTIELEGPSEYSPNDVADAFGNALSKPVNAVAVPEVDWENSMAHQGFSNAGLAGFIEMTQALNSGHIAFRTNSGLEHRKGRIPLAKVIRLMMKL
ncbi:NmrA family NAD(P)-binding protein [Salmonella enterica]|nr:NmrA family NAD(P)-binding protein [Salmonella enterica]EGF5178112.1 NmrA family NAD(P)-binding protein [Salmonella enterica subsp. enterica serovar Newport]